ncbi:MAG: 30S ribosomal protein S10 [Parcubacteria group bacterium GW2011_GWF2_38_8]|nr:MAG: 30S ribosomal protein S10 [Parcubacteria group bacterium GW2011_GWF2_38_8]
MSTKEPKTKKSKVLTQKDGVKKISAKSGKKPVSAKKEKKSARASVEESKIVLRIRVRAYESKILDSSVKQIIDTAMRYDANIVGPVPLPTEIKKYTVNRASFIYKNTREQFEIRVHKRLIDIINPNAKTVEALTNLSLPSGVDIDVKML